MNGQIDFGEIKPTRYFFAVAFVLGVLFSLTSNDGNTPPLLSFLQWQLQTLVPITLLIGANMVLLKNSRFTNLNPWFALLISGLVDSLLFAPISNLIDHWLKLEVSDNTFSTDVIHEWINVVLPITLSWLAMNSPWVLGYRIEKRQKQGVENEEEPVARQQTEFMSQVPPEKAGKLYFLKAELHYLQVVTEKGSSLVLYNLSDAVSELSAEAGVTVHRSYWVAYDAIKTLTRRGRQGVLELQNGDSVPVSRSKLKNVSELIAAREG